MKSLNKDLCFLVTLLSFFVLFASAIVYCSGCSRLNLPGPENITSIKGEVCYDLNMEKDDGVFCLEGEGKDLKEWVDSLTVKYRAAEEAIEEEKQQNAKRNGT